jgi:hypothetical protein
MKRIDTKRNGKKDIGIKTNRLDIISKIDATEQDGLRTFEKYSEKSKVYTVTAYVMAFLIIEKIWNTDLLRPVAEKCLAAAGVSLSTDERRFFSFVNEKRCGQPKAA